MLFSIQVKDREAIMVEHFILFTEDPTIFYFEDEVLQACSVESIACPMTEVYDYTR